MGSGKREGEGLGMRQSDTLCGKNEELVFLLTCPRFTALVSAANAVNSTLEGRTVELAQHGIFVGQRGTYVPEILIDTIQALGRLWEKRTSGSVHLTTLAAQKS